MKGFKGLRKDLSCRDFQYEIGKSYETTKEVRCCKTGFHMCPKPLDVFKYYAPVHSRYCVVEGSGDMDKSYDKIACSKMTIKREMTLEDLYVEALANVDTDKTVRERSVSIAASEETSSLCATKEYLSIAAHTGAHSMAVTLGKNSVAVASNNQSVAYSAGKDSIAIVNGNYSKAVASCAIATGLGSVAISDSVAIATKNNNAEANLPGSVAISLYGGMVKGVAGSTLVFINDKGVKVMKVDYKSANKWYSESI